jgi:hypothetical protein
MSGGRCPVAVVGVADLQLDPSAGRPEPVLGHGHPRLLPDYVAPETDPGTADKLQAHARGLCQRTMDPCGGTFRLQHQQPRSDPPGMGAQPAQGVLLA